MFKKISDPDRSERIGDLEAGLGCLGGACALSRKAPCGWSPSKPCCPRVSWNMFRRSSTKRKKSGPFARLNGSAPALLSEGQRFRDRPVWRHLCRDPGRSRRVGRRSDRDRIPPAVHGNLSYRLERQDDCPACEMLGLGHSSLTLRFRMFAIFPRPELLRVFPVN